MRGIVVLAAVVVLSAVAALTLRDGSGNGPEQVGGVSRESLPVIDVETVRDVLVDSAGDDAHGVAASADGTRLFVARRSATRTIAAFESTEAPIGSLDIGAPLLHPNGFGHDLAGPAVFALVDDGDGPALTSAGSGRAPGSLLARNVDPAPFEHGIALDRQRGVLYGAGNGALTAYEVGEGVLAPGRTLRRTDLGPLLEGDARGVAVDPVTGDVYVADDGAPEVIRFDSGGVAIDILDLSAAGVLETRDIAVAPSADATDEPTVVSLYVVATEPGGGTAGIKELTTTPPVADRTAGTLETAVLRQAIDLGSMEPPTPDAAAVTWLPGPRRLLVADSEIDEYGYFDGTNLRTLGVDGRLDSVASTTRWSREPSGIAFDPAAGRLYTTDDDSGQVHEVDVGEDGTPGTSDDALVGTFETAAFGSTDPEDVAFDTTDGSLHVVDGANRQVFTVGRGPDAAFGTEDDDVAHFDVGNHGIVDPEAIAHHPDHDTLIVVDHRNAVAAELEKGGGLLRYIDLSEAGSNTRMAGAIWAPASAEGEGLALWVADRGIDDTGERDGMLYEFAVPPLGGGARSAVIGLPGPVSFGAVGVDTTLRRDAVISNRGTSPMTVSSVSVAGTDQGSFTVQEADVPLTVPPGRTATVTVAFTPSEMREFAASLVVASNARGRPSVVVPLSGVGVVPEPRLSASPSLVTFGSQRTGTSTSRELTVSNQGTAPLRIRSATLAGDGRSAFSAPDLAGETVPVDESVTSQVSFTPDAPGSYSATLRIRSNDVRGRTTVVRLRGRAEDGRSTIAVDAIHSGTSARSATVETEDELGVDDDHLYVAFVAVRPATGVESVTGLGGTWSPVVEQCSGRGQTAVSAFVTTTAHEPSVVAARFDSAAMSAAVTVVEYAGADLASPVGGVTGANTLGAGGGCAGGADSSAYRLAVDGTDPSQMVAGAVAMRHRSHTPGRGVAALSEVTAGSAGNAAGLGVVSRLGAEDGTTTTVAGSFDGDTDWAAVAFSIDSEP